MLQEWQAKPLEWKIERTTQRIKEFYKENKRNVYVSFSGGKDSTVLLELIRSIYPDIEGVFVDTGLEYPEIKDFVKKTSNVITLRPEMGFKEVLAYLGVDSGENLLERFWGLNIS